jgi:DNA-binding NarL/FixJ family response regulator
MSGVGHPRRMASTRVLVVDDHPFALSTLTAALAGRGIDVRGASTAREALALALESRPSVALLDLDLGPGPTGIDLAHALRKELPALGICLLTSYRDPRLAGAGLPTLPIGAIYLCKADVSDMNMIVETISLLEHAPLTRRASLHMASGPTVALTDTQMETMRLVAQGMTNAEIARTRNVTESAVERTLNRLANQLGVTADRSLNTRVQITRAYYALAGADGHDPLAP